jgi:hypothetical protein
MTKTNTLVAGITLAAALALGGIVFDSNPAASAGPLRDALNLSEIVIREAHVRFLPDGGCALRVDASHEPADDIVVAIDRHEYPFSGARCTGIQIAAAKAVALDIKLDGGVP